MEPVPTFAESWQKLKELEAPKKEQSRFAIAGVHRTPQQLNAQRQNVRRAREKAAAKVQSQPGVSFQPAPVATTRVLDTVAEFWARKQARLASSASSSTALP